MTMTKRSSHMPTFTTMAIRNRPSVLVRTRLNHSHCGVMMLQKISAQYYGAYGPVIRFQIMKPSYLLALYQPKKASEMRSEERRVGKAYRTRSQRQRHK